MSLASFLVLSSCSDGSNRPRTVITPNQPPAISAISDQMGQVNVEIGPLTFTVSDGETPAANLTVSVSSDNETLIANAQIGGSGMTRTVTVIPANNQIGVAVITVSVTDAGNLSAMQDFNVVITTIDTVFSDFTRAVFSDAANGEPRDISLLNLIEDGDSFDDLVESASP